VLHGQSRARCNATIGSVWELLKADSSGNNHALTWENDIVVDAVEVEAGCVG
jgi:hypothetical protein